MCQSLQVVLPLSRHIFPETPQSLVWLFAQSGVVLALVLLIT